MPGAVTCVMCFILLNSMVATHCMYMPCPGVRLSRWYMYLVVSDVVLEIII